MAFSPVMNLISGAPPIAPPKDNVSFTIDDNARLTNDNLVAGQVCKLHIDGKIHNAIANTLNAFCIALENGVAGDKIRVAYITPGTVYKAPVTGTRGNCHPGVDGVRLDAEGLKVDWSQVAGGPLTIVRLEPDADDPTTEGYAWVVFSSCALAPHTGT